MRSMADTDSLLGILMGAVAERRPWNMLTRSPTERRRGSAFDGRGVGMVLAKGVSVVADTISLLSVQMLDRSSSSYEEVVPVSERSVPDVDGLEPCCCGTQVLSMTHFFACPEGFLLIVLRGGLFGRSSSAATSKPRVKGHCVLSYCITCASTDLNCAMLSLSSSVS
jgi:hypothetical protein